MWVFHTEYGSIAPEEHGAPAKLSKGNDMDNLVRVADFSATKETPATGSQFTKTVPSVYEFNGKGARFMRLMDVIERVMAGREDNSPAGYQVQLVHNILMGFEALHPNYFDVTGQKFHTVSVRMDQPGTVSSAKDLSLLQLGLLEQAELGNLFIPAEWAVQILGAARQGAQSARIRVRFANILHLKSPLCVELIDAQGNFRGSVARP